MTEFRKQSDGTLLIGESAFRREFPNVSIPKPLTETIVNSLGYDWVFDGAQPNLTPPYQSSVRDGVEQIDGQWFTEFKIQTATGDAATAIDNKVAANKRSERDQLLKETDFYALSDVTMSEEMKTYRQSLRDIPTTSGADWPHNVTWPTKPS